MCTNIPLKWYSLGSRAEYENDVEKPANGTGSDNFKNFSIAKRTQMQKNKLDTIMALGTMQRDVR